MYEIAIWIEDHWAGTGEIFDDLQTAIDFASGVYDDRQWSISWIHNALEDERGEVIRG